MTSGIFVFSCILWMSLHIFAALVSTLLYHLFICHINFDSPVICTVCSSAIYPFMYYIILLRRDAIRDSDMHYL
uniref:Uncharacterized protein n=1 Tax=Oryza brachyantha TaxID=4533 RepID=J3LYZ8_ORYBR